MEDKQQQFFSLLAEFPRIETYWNKEKKELNIESLKNAIAAMSTGEQAVAKWLAGVWLGENQFNFDIFQHINNFDDHAMKLFKNWVNEPFFP